MVVMFRYLLIILIFLSVSLNAQQVVDNNSNIDIYKYAGQLMPKSLLNKTSVDFDNVPLEFALNSIDREYGLNLNYNKSTMPLDQPVHVQMSDVYVLEALLGILKNTGMTLQFTKGGNIAISTEVGEPGSGNSAKKQNTSGSEITGKVLDNSTGDPLPGANVVIKGTSLGAATNIEGKYTIHNVPPGNYTLMYTFIGFQTVEKSVMIMPGKAVELNAEMGWVAIKGQDVVITAQAEGQLQAINQQLSSESISSIVAADRIQEVPDANAAESVGRLPGVSIKRSSGEGNEVVIRGLQPRLNLITVNNIRMPSTNESNTAVGLAGISQYMLDGIEVRKSLNASDDADVVGGIVDLKLATAPEGYHWSAIADGTYNGLTDNYGSYRGTLQGSSRFFNNSLGIIAQVNVERADRTRERYSATFAKDERTSVNEGVYLQGGGFQMHDIVRDRFSTSILADYKLPDGKIQFNSIYNKFDEDSYQRNFSYSTDGFTTLNTQKDNRTNKTHNYSSINGLTLETGLFGYALFDLGASMTSGRRDGRTNNINLGYDSGAPSPIDPVFIQNLYGKTAYDVIPYFKDMRENYLINSLTTQKVDFEEKERALQTNLKVPFAISKQISGYVKMGGKMRFKDRDYDSDPDGGGISGGGDIMRTAILRDNPELNWPIDWRTRTVGVEIPAYPLYDNWSSTVLKDRVFMYDFCNRDLVDQVVGRLAATKWEHKRLAMFGAGDVQNDYHGKEKLYAGYIMTDIDWSKWVSLNIGVRYEHEETNYAGYGVIDIASAEDIVDTLDTVKRTNFFLLPSGQLRFNYADWGNLRLAYSQSLARPEYYAFIPHYYADLRYSLSSAAGNTNLKPALSHNYDVIFSFFTNRIGLFTVGGFYKKIDDFFYVRSFRVIDPAQDNLVHGYNVTVPQGEYINFWFNNTEKSTVKGLEFDWQTSFWYLPRPLNGLVLSANYTRLSSESAYFKSDIVKEYYGTKPWEFTEVRVDSFETRRLLDQPNNVYNISLGYDYKKFSLRLAYYYLGNTLASKGDYEENDTFTQGYQRLDLSIRQRLPINGLSMQVLWSNITAEPDEQYRWRSDFNTFEEYYGSTASLGIRYEF